MENSQISALFEEIANLLEMLQADAFRIRSYRNAARTVADAPERIEDLAADPRALRELPGIGKSICDQIEEILRTGTSPRLEELRRQIPQGVTEFMRVPGLGPKKAMLLHRQLGLSSLEELKEAVREHRLRDIRGFGEKTEEKVARGLELISRSAGRILLHEAKEALRLLDRELSAIRGIGRWTPAGSFRRRQETIGDLDVIIETADRNAVADALVKLKAVAEVLGQGDEKASVRLESGLQVDFRFTEPEAFGAAQMYFTGSKAHNIVLRRIAMSHGWKLNEYGLFEGDRRLAGRDEKEVFRTLGLPFIPPELREDRGEIDAALAGRLPVLFEAGALRGDLHTHTTETDGKASLEELVEAAEAHGYEYLAITDHSKAVTVARGMDEERLLRQADRIRELDRARTKIRVLAGVEVDILKDGELDLDPRALAGLDWVNASIHSHFELDEPTMTQRILRAIESGVVDSIAHPFGREIGRREPIRFDFEAVCAACRRHAVSLEIDSYPSRLDLPDIYCKRAKELGVMLTISSDAHKLSDLGLIEYGVEVARRGWLEQTDIRNALPVEGFLRTLRRRSQPAPGPGRATSDPTRERRRRRPASGPDKATSDPLPEPGRPRKGRPIQRAKPSDNRSR